HVIGAEGALGEPLIVRLGLELVVDPGGLARRRVGQGESDGLGPGALKVVRSAKITGVDGEAVDGVALLGRQRAGYLRGKSVLGVQVNSAKTRGPHDPEGRGDDGAPVTALSGPVLI